MNMLDRTSGQASVLGLDCRRDMLEIRRRIGFVAEGQVMYEWMSIDEIIWFCKGFYPGWDDAYAAEMKVKLELDGHQKVRNLSHGQQAKLALLLSMAYRPELLILDEPTTGLDVVVRRNFLEGVIELIQEEGRTVFFSSHLVHEVERVADWVGFIDKGRMVCCAPMEELKGNVRRLTLTFETMPNGLHERIPDVLRVDPAGRQASVIVRRFSAETIAAVQALKPSHIDVADLGLEDIFVALVGNSEEA